MKDSTRSLITNPGYFRPLAKTKIGELTVYNYEYEYAKSKQAPSYKDITGLKDPITPSAKTAEEWLLINNSDMFHPFHIHISPFFVEEIGQLSYNANPEKKGEKKWTLHTLTMAAKDKDKPFSWVVGNWWDVITIPPHGYVRMKTWINVPSQLPLDKDDPNSDLFVHDNANVYGSWVMHCHILRHEDRGMMHLVNTKPLAISLQGKWTTEAGKTNDVVDNQGGLTLKPTPEVPLGTFNRGIGNPLYSQPYLGSIRLPDVQSFCATTDANTLLLSNGRIWVRGSKTPPETTFDPVLNLAGRWKDDSGNLTQIEQPKSKGHNFGLTFVAITPVWWAKSEGSWNPGTQGSPTVYAGTQHLLNNAGQNQQLTFTVSGDLQTIVFGNGVTWTKDPK